MRRKDGKGKKGVRETKGEEKTKKKKHKAKDEEEKNVDNEMGREKGQNCDNKQCLHAGGSWEVKRNRCNGWKGGKRRKEMKKRKARGKKARRQRNELSKKRR